MPIMFPYYAYYGYESGTRLHHIHQVEKVIRDAHGEGLIIDKFYLSEDKVEGIITALDNGMLFASHTLAIINNAELLNKKKDIQALVNLTVGGTTTIIFASDSDKLDNNLLSLVHRSAREHCHVLDDAQKKIWVSKYLSRKGLHIQPDALDLFLSLVAGNTLEMRHELDKALILLSTVITNKKELTSELIEHYIYHSRAESVSTLFNAYKERDFPKALEILHTLGRVKRGDETSILIRMVYHIRQLTGFGHNSATIQRHIAVCSEFEMMLRQHKPAMHHHIIQLWLYSLFFPSLALPIQNRDRRLFNVSHHRFD